MSATRRQVRRLLVDLDQPRVPRAAFTRALHDELFGDDLDERPSSQARGALGHDDDAATGADDAPIAMLEAPPRLRPAGRRWWFGAVAAAVALLVGVGSWLAIGRSDGSNVTTRPPSIDAVCTRFNRTAFGEIPRPELLGSGNAPLFADAPTARRRITALRVALVNLIDDFRANGISDTAVTSALQRAIGDADTALGSVEAGRVNSIGAEVGGVEFALLQAEQGLAADGIVGCL